MTSTHNLNQPYEYACEKKQNKDALQYRINNVYSEQKNPCQMFVLGSIPSHMNAKHFSYNPIDLESGLRGIRSCNLEGVSFRPALEKKDFYTQEIFTNNLKEPLYVPRPFFHNPDVRKGFHNI